jgi:hypothetical protein
MDRFKVSFPQLHYKIFYCAVSLRFRTWFSCCSLEAACKGDDLLHTYMRKQDCVRRTDTGVPHYTGAVAVSVSWFDGMQSL